MVINNEIYYLQDEDDCARDLEDAWECLLENVAEYNEIDNDKELYQFLKKQLDDKND